MNKNQNWKECWYDNQLSNKFFKEIEQVSQKISATIDDKSLKSFALLLSEEVGTLSSHSIKNTNHSDIYAQLCNSKLLTIAALAILGIVHNQSKQPSHYIAEQPHLQPHSAPMPKLEIPKTTSEPLEPSAEEVVMGMAKRGITKSEIALITGYTQNTISRYLNPKP